MNDVNLNLTRSECAARGAQVELDTQRVELDLSEQARRQAATFASRSTIDFASTQDATWLDLVAERLVSVTVNGSEQHPAYDGARVPVTGLHTDGTMNQVVIEARCRYAHSGEGMHRFTDPVDGNTYSYTHFEPTDARRAFACFEQPDLKARFTFSVSAPADCRVYSNGVIAEESADDARRTVTFTETPPLSPYLTAVAAGPFHPVADTWQVERVDGSSLQIPLRAICRASMAPHFDAEEILRVTKLGLSFFDEAFAFPYPWGTYDQIFVPEYNIGAMEHPGLVSFSENSYVFRGTASESQHESRAETIMHEMAHMWFGDLVTPRWWDDTWLKESFADLMGYLAATDAAGFAGSWVSFALQRKQWAYGQDQLPTTHPIVADIPDIEAARANFDGITYAKGAAVLKQLMAYVGRDTFFAAAQRYFAEHAFGSTTLQDLIDALDESSPQDLTGWVPVWLETTGPSRIGVDREGGAVQLTLDSVDRVSGESVSRPHRLSVSTFGVREGALVRTGQELITVTGDRTPTPFADDETSEVVIANDDDLTYGLLRLDQRSRSALLQHVSSLQPALTRAVAWSALWNDVREARLPAEEFVTAFTDHARDETDAGMLRALAQYAHSAVTAYLAPSRRQSVADALLGAVTTALHDAAPGSDLQRAWADSLAAVGGLAPSAAPALRELLDGRIPGLELTPMLRWELIAALAQLGGLDPVAIEQAYDQDRTMSGAIGRDRASASLPGVAVKQRVWEELTRDDRLTNDAQRALLAGFATGDPDQTAPFAEPYFEQVASWWRSRTMVTASRLAAGLFPRADIDGGLEDNPVVRAAQDWLTKHRDAPQALRRIVIEQLDQTGRELRAQSRTPDAADIG